MSYIVSVTYILSRSAQHTSVTRGTWGSLITEEKKKNQYVSLTNDQHYIIRLLDNIATINTRNINFDARNKGLVLDYIL